MFPQTLSEYEQISSQDSSFSENSSMVSRFLSAFEMDPAQNLRNLDHATPLG